LSNYEYVIEDPSSPPEQQTISYEFFENGTWTYNHKEHLDKLRSLVKSYRLGKNHSEGQKPTKKPL
jgi:hypothetical protein